MRSLALSLAVSLAGCSALRPVPPAPPAALPAVPAAWSGAAEGVAPGAAWAAFADPELDRLLARARAANTSVAGARGALAQARALRDVAGAALGPTLGAAVSAQRNRDDGAPSSSHSGSVSATWDPDIAGEKAAATRARVAEIDAAVATLADAQLAVAAATASSYFELRGTADRLAIARATTANQRDTAQLTQWRMQAGLTTSLEHAQAQAALEQAAARVPALELALAQQRHALAILCGLPPAALDAELAGPAPLPAVPALPAAGIPADVLRARPDIGAAERRVKAAWERVGEANAARYASFHLDFTLGLHGVGIGGGGTLARTLLGSVSGSAFDAGAGYAQVLAQQGALAQAEAAWRAAVLKALAEVEDQLAAGAANRAQLAGLERGEVAAGDAALLARQRYASGLADFQTVLDTQRTLYALQDSAAATRTALLTGQVALLHALGGRWNSDGETSQ
jgi:NodT family efflux transporter outer membrane factor (OMF) lipoprotein